MVFYHQPIAVDNQRVELRTGRCEELGGDCYETQPVRTNVHTD